MSTSAHGNGQVQDRRLVAVDTVHNVHSLLEQRIMRRALGAAALYLQAAACVRRLVVLPCLGAKFLRTELG